MIVADKTRFLDAWQTYLDSYAGPVVDVPEDGDVSPLAKYFDETIITEWVDGGCLTTQAAIWLLSEWNEDRRHRLHRLGTPVPAAAKQRTAPIRRRYLGGVDA